MIGLYSTDIAESCEYVWTGVAQNNNDDFMSIYPNPATATFSVETSGKANLELRLTDVLGRIYLRNDFSEKINPDLSSFSKGIYFISVYDNGKWIGSKKIVKK